MFLLNPKQYDRFYPDDRSRDIMLKTIDFFERKGLARVKEDDRTFKWYGDFPGLPETGTAVFAIAAYAVGIRGGGLPVGYVAELRLQ